MLLTVVSQGPNYMLHMKYVTKAQWPCIQEKLFLNGATRDEAAVWAGMFVCVRGGCGALVVKDVAPADRSVVRYMVAGMMK